MARVGWNGGEGEESQVGDSGREGGSVALGEEVGREEVEAGWAGEREEDGEEKAHGWRGEAITQTVLANLRSSVSRSESRRIVSKNGRGVAGSMPAVRKIGGRETGFREVCGVENRIGEASARRRRWRLRAVLERLRVVLRLSHPSVQS
jgi:hypothetical protein